MLLSVFAFLREPGCGVLYDYGVYYVTCLCALLGSVKEVTGVCRTPYESQIAAILQLTGGITGTLNINTDSVSVNQAFFTVYGTKGILYLTDPNQFGGEVKLLMNSLDPRIPNEPKKVINYFTYSENSRGIGPSDMADAMLHFYRDILGMKEQFTLPLKPVVEQYVASEGNEAEWTAEQKNRIEQFKTMADKPWLTYLKLSDNQFIELFYDIGRSIRTIDDRKTVYGYTKFNYEVDDVLALKEHLLAESVALKDDYHPTVDGVFEISVLDPDGNEVQFTQYGPGAKITHIENPDHKVNSWVNYTTQVAYDVQDTVNMPAFYGAGLGLKKALTLYVGDLIPALEASDQADARQIAGMKMMADKPWIEYYEVGPHQYIELFYSLSGALLQEDRNLEDAYGYQHICMEVTDIHKAWDAVTSNGIVPDTEISRGMDGAYQFWVTDPDGNRMEFMEYAQGAMQMYIS